MSQVVRRNGLFRAKKRKINVWEKRNNCPDPSLNCLKSPERAVLASIDIVKLTLLIC